MPSIATVFRTLIATVLTAPLLFLAQAQTPAQAQAQAQTPDPSAAIVRYERADREQMLAQGARKEGEVSVYTSLTAEELAALSAAFDKKYAVKVRAWRAGSEKVLQRATTEARSGRHDADVIETNGPELEALYREQLLMPLYSPHLAELMPQSLRPHGHWVGTRLNMFVHAYNTKLVKKEELPTRYADLADPRWKGRLGIEAEDEDWFATVVKGLGEEAGLKTFREIAKTNGFSVRKGHTLLAGLVASGEVPFALTAYSHGVEKMKQKGAPVEWFAIAPAIGRANGIAIVRGAPHPHAAALFVDFMLGVEAQAILEKGGYVPANLRLANRAHQLPLVFVDPATVLDEDAKWKKLYAEIVLGAAK
ncbi:MAG: extracellular solute-binding protein [Pseudomonadota bacterium]|nr:extracellular solute-binding protein [Pseudomonadota bacterium]